MRDREGCGYEVEGLEVEDLRFEETRRRIVGLSGPPVGAPAR